MFRGLSIGIQRHKAYGQRIFLLTAASSASYQYSSTPAVTWLERKGGNGKASSFFGSIFNKQDDMEDQSTKEQTQKSTATSFFNSSEWEDLRQDFWNRIMSDSSSNTKRNTPTQQEVPNSGSNKTSATKTAADFTELAGNFLQLFGSKEQQDHAISNIVKQARETASKSDLSDDDHSFSDLVDALSLYAALIAKVADKYVSSIDFSRFEPTALFYYLEYEDERKNPSWKRRQHRFFDGIDIEQIEQLNNYLELSRISYANSVEEIQQGLENRARPCELIYAEVVSRPGRPANFVAIPRDQPRFSNHLEVIIGVRGTKSLSDAVTDLICEDVDFRGGKAHSFIVNSGKFIVEKHTHMLQEILRNSGKSKLKLTLVGHSLGAGAASIAGMEFQDNEKFDVQVVGFGCPALVSQELATKADYITTVVNDSDMVPRLSGHSVANLLMDVLEFDWFPYAERDAEESIQVLHERQPLIFNRDLLLKLKSALMPKLEAYANSLISKKTTDRAEIQLFPPGKCIHIYRDGVGFSATLVPNHFFSEIDVTRRMIDDHVFHNGYQQTFLELMRQHRGDHHFRFSDDKNLNSK